MIKKLFLALVISSAILGSACSPGDEDPPEQDLTILGQSLPDLLGFRALSGYYWEGVATLEQCSYTPLTASTAGACALLQDAKNVVDENIPNNTVLTVSTVNGVEASLVVFVPHFDFLPNGYTVSAGGTIRLDNDKDRNVLTLTQSGVTGTPTTTTRALTMNSFQADDLDETLRGRAIYTLTETGKADAAVLTYSFDLTKKY